MRRRTLLSSDKKDYSQEYFTMVVTTGGDITWTGSTTSNILSYSKNNGTTWITANSGTTISVAAGDKVLWKGTSTPKQYSGIGKFGGDTNVRYSIKGNVMSLLFGDNFKGQTSLSGKDYALYRLFESNKNVTSAENLSLPATTLANNCYSTMFANCTNLTIAPALPATTLASSCYYYMFNGCSSLTTAPVLSATTLANNCYSTMFANCTNLTIAPALPATTLKNTCYYLMFDHCTSLTTAPELPATTLASDCYGSMFSYTNVLPDCTNIDFSSQSVVASGGLQGLFEGTKITDAQLDAILKEHGINNYSLPVTTLASSCYRRMFKSCTSLTTAPALPATTLANSCYESMFYYCTNLTTAPVLSATTLASRCYDGMFYNCTSLTTAPVLSATTLANYCYAEMFQGCSSLTTAPVLPATTLADYCYASMFKYCISLTTAPELPATTLKNTCYYSMFQGCTRLNSIKCLATNIRKSFNCTNNWVNGVAASGTFTKAASMSDWTTGINGIPSGWTVQDAS